VDIKTAWAQLLIGAPGGPITQFRVHDLRHTFASKLVQAGVDLALAPGDTVWVSNFAGAVGRIAHLCGVKTENCPPGMNTGDQISPPGGYVGGGLQMQTDLAISPSGDVWVIDNWQDINSCYGDPDEALSTRCGGQGVTIFFGMAKPVRAPQIGPARPY
jgi:hypothetical protein